MLSILNHLTKSLSVEVTKLIQLLGLETFGTKQAFSKARYKIRPEAFVDLNDTFIQSFYGLGGYKQYRDRYVLLATDGSSFELPWTVELRDTFGVADNGQGSPKCMLQGVKIYDVLNGLTVSAALDRYEYGEVRLFQTAWQHARQLFAALPEATRLLLLGDMHYPSFWLMADLQAQGVDFLFRCRPDFCREIAAFMQSGQAESVLRLAVNTDKRRRHAQKKAAGPPARVDYLTIRALRVVRPNGEVSCLVTSLTSEQIDNEGVRALYPLRWREEVSFDFDKNPAQIENFAAKRAVGVKQEWYANILATNMTRLLVEDAQEQLDQQQNARAKPAKYAYQINHSVALGLVKGELPKLLFGQYSATDFYHRMIQLIVRHREPIRPNRSFPRKRKHKLKFSMNLRRVL